MILLLLMACAGEQGADELRSGDYEFSTVAMDDACLDGALEALFMPQGRDTPQVFEYPIYVPGLDEVPMEQEISLREPFVGMPISVQSGQDGRLFFEGGVMTEVLLDEGLYGDCAATMTVSAWVEPVEKTVGIGQAVLDLSDFAGDEGRCPLVDADPCRVTLELSLERL